MRIASPILSTVGLSIGYHNGKHTTTVMNALNLNLYGSKLTALLGRNGIGKSTLLRTLAGSQQALSGTVQLDGSNLDAYRKEELSKKMSLVYTDRTLAGGLTVSQLVSLGRYPHTGFFGRLGKRDRIVVEESMAATGIIHKRSAFVAELSDGERQKAMISRALAQETPVIMLDEPTAFLDVASRIEVMTLLHTLAKEQGKAVLLSTHDISQALLLSDYLWIVTHDHHISCGCTEDLIIAGAMQQMFPPNAETKVRFDANIGDFEAQLPTDKGYMLECEDTLLRHLISNALRRNGIAATGNDGTITAASPTELIVRHRYDHTPILCQSVATLIEKITNT